jgi:uncharacterized protein (TIGR03086 family)
MDPFDFAPTTSALGAIVRGVRPDQLSLPTPCPDYTVADLLDHVGGLTLAFTAAARKEPLPGDGGPTADGDQLPDGWRELFPARLATLATAWADPAAYAGTTMAGPVEMPAEGAAMVALDEVTVHAWDLAVATGQPYAADPAAVAACHAFALSFEPPSDVPEEAPGLFGPRVAVPADAPPLALLLGATGRDPRWSPDNALATGH